MNDLLKATSLIVSALRLTFGPLLKGFGQLASFFGVCAGTGRPRTCHMVWVYVYSLACAVAVGGEPTVVSNDLPRFPAVPVPESLKTFRVRPGFHVEIAAAEPNVVSPVALAFDENGRMFVVEMVDYSERRDEVPHLGCIRVLEDKDGDGVYETSSVFAENLPWPTAVFCYDGGIFVGATPDIIYLKDTDGDGKADLRETVFTGFANGVARVNVQAMLNSFIWGLDNRIHGATSGNGGKIRSRRHPGDKVLDLQGRDFVIDPRTFSMTSEAGGGQHGLSFDDGGRRFACNNSDHIRLFVYDDRYATRNPNYAMPSPLASIAVDGPAAEVYRISPEEPWRVLRTRWRVTGVVPGLIEGGGRASGYFTGATGTTIYRGNAFPKEYLGHAFVADCGGNLVHHKILLPDDVSLKAQRPADEEKVEFMASTDTWFRPVQFANAPDGTLFVIDMYREVIEHPWSLPENIKKFLDLNSGNNRGRIYRIAPDGFKQPAPPRIGKASTRELVALLGHSNGWHRDTAARLLYERRDPAAGPLLGELLKHSDYSLARLHALYALVGLDALRESQVLRALSDPDPLVREHAIRLSENFISRGTCSPELLAKLQELVEDPGLRVRYQLAFTCGELRGAQAKVNMLSGIALRDWNSAWVQAAVLSSLSEDAGELFTRLSKAEGFCEKEQGQEFLRNLVLLMASKNNQAELEKICKYIATLGEPSVRFALVRALGDGVQRSGGTLSQLSSVREVTKVASEFVEDPQRAEPARVQAALLLGLSSFEQSGPALLNLLSQKEPQALQLAALSALNRFDSPQLASQLVARWPELTPRLRSELIVVLLARPERATTLLEAIQSGKLRTSELASTQVQFLQNHRSSSIRQLATQVLSTSTPTSRQKVVDSYVPALKLTGDAAHGRKIYQERCISCHRLGNEGHALGPDLVTVKNSGKEKILINILDPNREVRPEFISYLAETKDDESLLGLVTSETSTSVTLRQAYGTEHVLRRSDIKKLQSQGQSLMPEGLETGLTPQDFADLIECIETTVPGPSQP